MEYSSIALIGVSVFLQFMASVFAIRLIRTAPTSRAWWLISLAFILMCIRRGTILWRAVLNASDFKPDLVSEWFGVVIALFLLLGVLAFGRFFLEKQKTSHALRESEWLLEWAQQVGHSGSYRLDIPSNRWAGSKVLMDLLGIDETYPMDMDGWLRLAHPDQREELAEYIQKEVFGKRRPFDYDYRIIRPRDGQMRWVHGMGMIEPDETGKPKTLVGTIQDITDRMVGVMGLKEGEGRFRSIADNANDGYIIHDFNGTILDCNENQCRILGYRRDELVGRSLAEIDSPHEKELYEERTRILKETGKVEFDGFHVTKDGREIPVAVSARLISREGKGITQAYIRDITERENAERALRESEQRFRTLAESLSQAVFETDLAGKLTYANRSAHEMFGYSPEDMRDGLNAMDTIAPEDRSRASETFGKIVRGGAPTRGNEYLGLRKNGVRFPILMYTNTRMEKGRVTGTLGLIVDATEAKQAEEERRRLQEQFFQAQKMESIGTLAGGIAHDFNNLLSGLLGGLSIMEIDTEGRPDLQKEVASMKALVKRGAGLTRQLLGFARRGKYDVQPLGLKDVIESTLDLFQRTRKDIVVRKESPRDDVTVLGDRSQIEQVLMNLFVNAGQAMPDGGRLTVQWDRTALSAAETGTFGAPAGSYARVTVTDTGIGMDAATMERIFEPFFTTKAAGQGTGLGLASVYGIVKNHGGFVKVESQVGQGATFTVLLPSTNLASEGETAVGKSILSAEGLAQNTLLLVDDEETILRTSSRLLRDIGFKVLTARNGLEALETFRKEKDRIAVVILDMVMPGLNGLETFEAMKSIHPPVKVLMASGYSREGQAAMVLEAGCKGFIEKPFDLEDLSVKLKELM